MTKRCKLRNVSTTYQERYTSSSGNVIVERIHHGAGRDAWQVLRRGREPYIVSTKAQAFDAACAKRRH